MLRPLFLKPAVPRSFFRLNGLQASAVKLQQVVGVFIRFGGGTRTLKTHARRSGTAVAGSHSDKLHQIEGDVLIAASARGDGSCFVHKSLRGNANAGNVVIHLEESGGKLMITRG